MATLSTWATSIAQKRKIICTRRRHRLQNETYFFLVSQYINHAWMDHSSWNKNESYTVSSLRSHMTLFVVSLFLQHVFDHANSAVHCIHWCQVKVFIHSCLEYKCSRLNGANLGSFCLLITIRYKKTQNDDCQGADSAKNFFFLTIKSLSLQHVMNHSRVNWAKLAPLSRHCRILMGV